MEKRAQFKTDKLILNRNSELPESPGVYKFFNSRNEILYIGKAKNIKKRVKSYLIKTKGEGKRISRLKSSIKFVETIITKSESDALILEQGLISKIRPPFNIQFRDDKSYPAIHLTTNQKYPAIYVSRQKNTENTIFGPFANVGAMRLNVNLIRSTFKLRNCKDINFKNRSRPCIEYQMNRCSAPCVGYISEKDYSMEVKNAINFLSGESKNIINDLNHRMDFYSKKEDYERAIIYRDKIQSIRDTQKKQNVLTGFDELDVISFKKNRFTSCVSVLRVESGWITSSQNFYPDNNQDLSEKEMMSIFLESYVTSNKKRKEINLLFVGSILKETFEFLEGLDFPKINIFRKTKKNENLIEICSSQAEDALKRNNNYFWITKAFEDLKDFLSLYEINRVEAFDVSHTSGKQVSASCVVMNKDGPDKKNYRIMNIKNDLNDDYVALSEAIFRRCKNLLKNKISLPEVILIDGGKGQLNKVKNLIDNELKQKITFISISKGPNRKEKYDFLHFDEKKQELKKSEKISKLLQLLRNESHRFALNHHRRRRSKNLLKSDLDNINGLGPTLKLNLIRFFGGVDKVMDASIEELETVPGIGKAKAKHIYSYIRRI